MTMADTRMALPSTSTSLVRTLPEPVVFSLIVRLSLAVVTASFTPVTVRARVETEVARPSETVTLTIGTAPKKLAAGMKE